MRILYPDDPLNQLSPDQLFLPEYELAQARGFAVSIFSFEEFELGRFKAKPRPAPGEAVLYRGWMLNLGDYTRLSQALEQISVRMLISPENYQATHHLPSWYPFLQDYTAETLVFAEDTDFADALAQTNWPGYFVKDYVKSLNTAEGSLVSSPTGIASVVAQLKKYRGEIEGGVCVRHQEDYKPGSERRYFVAAGEAFSADGEVPTVVALCAARISSPFFSIDVAERSDGVLRIIELGDGQVSDLKEWSPEQLVDVLKRIAMTRV